jgi:hypothetical protein
MPKIRTCTAAWASAALLVGLACFSEGCAKPKPDSTGAVGISLTVGSQATLAQVSYTLTGPAAFSKTGTLNVAASTTISGTVGGIPAGDGYTVRLDAVTTDAAIACSGTSPAFTVKPQATTPVAVHLLCQQGATTGSVMVNGTVNVCPVIDGIGAAPAEVLVGGTIALTGLAHDSDSGPSPLTYAWTATFGVFSDPSAMNPVFTCTTPGAAMVTVDVSDGDVTCNGTASLLVTCTASITGRWSNSRRRLDLVSAQGIITGDVYVKDPKTGDWQWQGDITGAQSGNVIDVVTTSNLRIHGIVSDATFEGTMEYPGSPPEIPPKAFPLSLSLETP